MNAVSDLNFEAGIDRLPERQASLWGFRSGDRGTHTSRTIMLDELSQLLDAVPGEAATSGLRRRRHTRQLSRKDERQQLASSRFSG